MIKDKRLFGYLKDRKIFCGRGARTFREYQDSVERKLEFNDVARRGKMKRRIR